jgi:hypothetical protein
MKFTLYIHLGNESMQDLNALGSALADVSRAMMDAHARGLGPTVFDEGRVRDLNGNTVGQWFMQDLDRSDAGADGEETCDGICPNCDGECAPGQPCARCFPTRANAPSLRE